MSNRPDYTREDVEMHTRNYSHCCDCDDCRKHNGQRLPPEWGESHNTISAPMYPTFYVRHPDDSYSVADPQPADDRKASDDMNQPQDYCRQCLDEILGYANRKVTR